MYVAQVNINYNNNKTKNHHHNSDNYHLKRKTTEGAAEEYGYLVPLLSYRCSVGQLVVSLFHEPLK